MYTRRGQVFPPDENDGDINVMREFELSLYFLFESSVFFLFFLFSLLFSCLVSHQLCGEKSSCRPFKCSVAFNKNRLEFKKKIVWVVFP